jgi:hypothetical protein
VPSSGRLLWLHYSGLQRHFTICNKSHTYIDCRKFNV